MNDLLVKKIAKIPTTVAEYTDNCEAVIVYTSEEEMKIKLCEVEARYPETEVLFWENGVLVVKMPRDILIIGPEGNDDD